MEEKKNKIMLMGVVIGERKRSSTCSSSVPFDFTVEDSENAKKPVQDMKPVPDMNRFFIQMEEKKNKIMLMGFVIGERKRSSTSSSPVHFDFTEEDCEKARKPVPDVNRFFFQMKYGRKLDFVYLASKKLGAADTSKDSGGLIFPKTRALMEALTDNEKRILGMYGEDGPDKKETMAKSIGHERSKMIPLLIRVVVVDPEGIEYRMIFKKEPNLDQLVLGPGWIRFVHFNSLKKDQIVDFWSFRVGSMLCFAVDFEKDVKLDLSLSL